MPEFGHQSPRWIGDGLLWWK